MNKSEQRKPSKIRMKGIEIVIGNADWYAHTQGFPLFSMRKIPDNRASACIIRTGNFLVSWLPWTRPRQLIIVCSDKLLKFRRLAAFPRCLEHADNPVCGSTPTRALAHLQEKEPRKTVFLYTHVYGRRYMRVKRVYTRDLSVRTKGLSMRVWHYL